MAVSKRSILFGIRLQQVHASNPAKRLRVHAMTQMLRRLTLFVLRWCQNLHGAAGFLHRGDGRFRGAMDLDIDLGLDLTTSKQSDAILGTAEHSRLHQRLSIDRRGNSE